jgi:anti-sigma regulatory factor (Ser/Thr protein kinase)
MAVADDRALLDHPVLLYDSLEQFLRVMVPFVKEGIDQDEVTFVAARGDYLPALRERLGERANEARFADTFEWYPHPATRLRAFNELVRDELAAGATRFRLAGEPVWPSGSPSVTREWQRYESVLNSVLGPYPVSLMCLYDATTLEPSILETARRTHPTSSLDGVRAVNDEFTEPVEFLAEWQHDLTPIPPSAITIPEVRDVAAGRHFLEAHALSSGVAPAQAVELSTAANEILTNSFLYATPPSLTAWVQGIHYVCQIEDKGAGLRDEVARYRPPIDVNQNGRGLWMARQLVDLIQIVGGHAGTTVRLHIRRI